MKKISITTVFKGFNYGSSLQAYASKKYLSSLGYEAEIIGYRDGLIKGRDIRFKKLFVMLLRTFWRPSLFKKTFSTYKKSLQKEINEDAKKAFLEFTDKRLQVKKYTWRGLKLYARSDNVLACVCGSDQIWNATNIYIDPIFYLKFAPKQKRIAYAPSFGKSKIPKYNKGIIRKYVSRFDYLSVREEQGANIIKDLTGIDVPVMIDPTLLLDKTDWLNTVNDLKACERGKKYILLYFLDKPSSAAIWYIERLIEVYNCSAIAIPYQHSEFDDLDCYTSVSAGPLEFIDLVLNASFVCTDSFHGTAFSINLNIPFLTFKRNYGTATDQSSRITSLLDKLKLEDKFISETESSKEINLEYQMSFENSNRLLACERQKAKEYLLNSLAIIESKTNCGGS
ncbi:polysaccharide pyruvyl transferase family protein [Desulfosporosinus fructosivorans]